MPRGAKQTPMMAQYHRLKKEIPPDALLLFRLGDFYEMFFDDANEGARILNVALTKRGDAPMCGIPFHAAATYISRLLKAGKKVAICEQVEDARPGQLVKREVTRIISPGTHFDERLLVAERNNYLAAVYPEGGQFGLAFADLTTGEFKSTELPEASALIGELERLRPAEIIIPGEAVKLKDLLSIVISLVSPYEDWAFAPEYAQHTLLEHLKVASLDGFGLRNRPLAVGAAGAVLHYLGQHLRHDLSHLLGLSFYEESHFLKLDSITLRNLEILESIQPDAPRAASLYRAVNRTVTPMGARRLRDWLTQPLCEIDAIHARQMAIQTWLDHPDLLERVRVQLNEVRDLERTIGRLSAGGGNARDLLNLKSALEQIPGIRQTLTQLTGQVSADKLRDDLVSRAQSSKAGEALVDSQADLLAQLFSQLVELPEIVDQLNRAVVDEPPIAVKEGGIVRDGFDDALDELRAASRDGKEWIAKLQQTEIERTRIPSLKVRYNSVFGYFIEVTKTHLSKVPDNYHRKQTIANGERFITPELKEIEGKILGAEERGVKLEYEIFLRLRERVIGRLAAIQQIARALAQLDVLAAFAELARVAGYRRPVVSDEGVIDIRDGRHPVLDQVIGEEPFVPNDARLNPQEEQIVIITGPNMAGKSTFIRQAALLTLLAHTGSFIPASEARIDRVDRIFTRIGASDDLARGQSTFMVEMSETANILNNATPQSLIILDEIGRGTSTFDGLSLAWSIVEHLHNTVGAKTLFASHYHELTELAGRLPRVHNFNVAVREWNDRIIFLRKIVPGGTDKSYGIQVARLAGVPKPVLTRAREILRNLEESELTPAGAGRAASRKNADREKLKQLPPAAQLDLFAPGKDRSSENP